MGRQALFLGACLLLCALCPTRAALGSNCTDTFSCGDVLVCDTNTSTCEPCQTNEECQAISSLRICGSSGCTHKSILPLLWQDILLCVLLALGGAVAAGGGVGGGGIFVPVLIFVGGFITKEAIPLSNALIGGASIANFLQMVRRRHPRASRPLIYYDLAILIQPVTLSGTVIGVLLYSMFPDWLILGLLVIVLLSTTVITFNKGRKLYKQENAQLQQTSSREMSSPRMKGRQAEEAPPSEELLKIIEKEKRTPWLKVLGLFLVLGVVTVLSIAKGGNSGTSIMGVAACSALYWVLVWLPFVLLLGAAGGVAWYLIRVDARKREIHYQFQEGDVQWTVKNTLVTASLSIGAGIIASLVGIGGGMILGPLMLSLKVLPDVTAATSSFMIMFTSIASIVQFAVLGKLYWSYAGTFLVLGFLSSFAGQVALSWVIQRYRRKSYIIFLIVCVIAVSTVMLVVLGGINLVRDVQAHVNLSFSPFCK